MSVYTEWIEDVEERQRRLRRQQFWATARYAWRQEELRWKIFFTFAFFLLLASLLGAAIYSDGCAGRGGMQRPLTTPAALFSTARRA